MNNSIIKKNKLIKDLEDKDIQISNIKKELAKTRSKFKDLENVNNENEENIIMLENKLASRDQKVYELQEEIKTIEETAPITFKAVCDKCENVANTEKRLKEHGKVNHSDEDIPSTSKCGKCEYNSEDEDDLSQHMEAMHLINCDMCDFQSDSNTEADNHKQSAHIFPCVNYNLTFNSERKLSDHIVEYPFKIQLLVTHI